MARRDKRSGGPVKMCAVCGRAITPRKKWSTEAFAEVKYCSARCRGQRNPSRVDAALEDAIESLLERRAGGKTICPSEAARAVAGDDGDWRSLMEKARQAARRLVAAGRVDITQRGHVVDPSSAKGPIRIRRRQSG